MKTCSKVFLLENEISWEQVGEGIQRQILGYDGQLMLVKVKFQKGAIGNAHEHFHSQSTYVVSGVFEFHVNGEKKIVKAGDGIYMEPDVLHGCTCRDAGILIDTFSPMREDFINE